MRPIYDFMVIGGGILGLASALELQRRYPGRSVLLLEKESGPGQHQSGHSAGVLESGARCAADSLQARFCIEGNAMLRAFCAQHAITVVEREQLLIAHSDQQQVLQTALEHCMAQQIDAQLLASDELTALVEGLDCQAAVKLAAAGLVDFQHVCEKMAELFIAAGGAVRYQMAVQSLEEFYDRVTAYCSGDRFQARYLVTCAGLHADRMLEMLEKTPEFRTVAYRSERYLYEADPSVRMPMLAVLADDPTATPDAQLLPGNEGALWLQSEATPVTGRETYQRGGGVGDKLSSLFDKGKRKLMMQNLPEMLLGSTHSKASLQQICQRLPQLKLAGFKRHSTGVYAQAVLNDGTLVDDFLFEQTRRVLLLCHTPPYAATAALAAAAYMVDMLAENVRFAQPDDDLDDEGDQSDLDFSAENFLPPEGEKF